MGVKDPCFSLPFCSYHCYELFVNEAKDDVEEETLVNIEAAWVKNSSFQKQIQPTDLYWSSCNIFKNPKCVGVQNHVYCLLCD